jgi:phosphoglycerol transferase MdoB-like AlkP superfamily enzyme
VAIQPLRGKFNLRFFARRKVKKEAKEKRPHGKLYLRISEIANNRVFSKGPVQVAIISLILMFIIEGFEYKHFYGGFEFLIGHPLPFILNWLVVFTPFTIGWIFRRRIFIYVIVSVPWLTIGIANGIILIYRMTPFTTADLAIIDMGFDILPSYFSTGQLILMGGLILLAVAGIVFLCIKGPKRREAPNKKKALVYVLITVVAVSSAWNICVKTDAVSSYFDNLWFAYHDYGVPYCFLSTWLNKGIAKPAGYNAKMVNEAVTEDEKKSQTSENMSAKEAQAKFPNIVFIQLESFIDPSDVKNLEFSDVPVPYFKELKEKYPSGYLGVPVIGGGTANTEFSIMSGMDMKSFGPGEYPYKTVLKKETSETMAYDVKRLGYATHAIHNHRGAFYNRDRVFPNLGFDDFTSLEYMSYVKKTPRNYATDDVLQGEIIGAMDATEEKDYIYCISVQGHGEYPSTKTIGDPRITVSGAHSKENQYAWEYYIEQVMEMDDFIRSLTDELATYEEDVVLVMYGDHLPALNMTDDEMRSGSTFKTEYVLWANFELDAEDQNLEAYQLSARVQEIIGMREGTLTLLHQDRAEKTKYKEKLNLLQYDMLYGKRYIYDEKKPFERVDMKMGYNPIIIEEIVEVAGQYYIKGQGFTPFSKVTLDKEILDTVYIGPTVLKLNVEIASSDVSKMKVSQVEKYNFILSTTE